MFMFSFKFKNNISTGLHFISLSRTPCLTLLHSDVIKCPHSSHIMLVSSFKQNREKNQNKLLQKLEFVLVNTITIWCIQICLSFFLSFFFFFFFLVWGLQGGAAGFLFYIIYKFLGVGPARVA